MDDASLLIFRLLSIILIACVGYFLASRKTLGEHGKQVVSLLLNRVTMPLLIFSAVTSIQLTEENIRNALMVVVAALLVYLANFTYAKIRARQFKLNSQTKSVFTSGFVHSNTAFLAFPLLYAVYGAEGLFYATMYYLTDVTLLCTTGIGRLAHENKGKKKLIPATIALAISLSLMIVLNLLQIDITAFFFYQATSDLGNTSIVLAFLFIGMIIYESNLKELFMNKLALNLIVVKTTIIPLIFIVILKFLDLDVEYVIIIAVMTQAMMPPFSALLSLAYEYKQDVSLASSIVVIGHLYAMINIPILFTILVWLFAR